MGLFLSWFGQTPSIQHRKAVFKPNNKIYKLKQPEPATCFYKDLDKCLTIPWGNYNILNHS